MPSSVWLLVVANTIPIFGVLFFDWNVGNILILFWAENIVIGVYQLLKLITTARLREFMLPPFFLLHYGGFTFGHGVFVLNFFGDQALAPLDQLALLADDWLFLVGFAALFVSHGYSLVVNFFGSGEYQRRTAHQLFTQPYSRVMIMHITVIVGGIATDALGSPVWALVVLVALKTVVDVRAHLKSHLQAEFQQQLGNSAEDRGAK